MPRDWHEGSLDDLALFVEVARRQHFAKAAAATGVPPSTLSRRVARLEASLGTPLLVRTTRNVSLTDAGIELMSGADELLERLGGLLDGKTLGSTGSYTGTLRVAAPTVAGRDIFGPMLLEFVARHPRLRLEMRLGNDLVDLLSERMDFAFRLGPLADSDLVARRVRTIRYRLYASASFAERHCPNNQLPSLDALTKIPCVVVPPMMIWRFIGADPRPSVRPRAVDELEDLVLALRAVEMGRGLGYLPMGIVEREARTPPRMIDVAGVEPVDRPMYLVHPAASLLAPKVRAAIDHVMSCVESRS